MKIIYLPRLSIVLTIISLILWSISITQTRLEIGRYGIIGGFPALYFIALGILTIASGILWHSKENHSKLLLIQLVFLVISIWLAPLMVGGAQKLYAVAYGHLGWTEYVLRTGSIDAGVLWYLNWPGNFILHSSALLVTGANMDDFAKFLPWLPIIWQFILFFPVFIFFKNTFNNAYPNYAWAGMWVFYIGNWLGLQNNGPQPFGVFCVFSILAILSNTGVWKNNATVLGHRFSVILVFAASATVHMLGSFIALAISGGLWLSRVISYPKIIIAAVVFIAIWSMYGGVNYFDNSLAYKILQGFRIDEALELGSTTYVAGNADYSAVNKVKMLLSGMLIMAGIVGGILAFRSRREKDGNRVALSAAIACGAIAVGVGAAYKSEIFNRFFLFLLPFITYFAVKLLHHRYLAIVLTIILIICAPLSFISQHGNQIMDYVPQGYLNGAHFFDDHTVRGWVCSSGPLGQYSNRDRYQLWGYGSLKWGNNEMITLYAHHWDVDHYDAVPDYVSIGTFDDTVQSYYGNHPDRVDETQKQLEAATNCNLVFANTDMKLYIRQKAGQDIDVVDLND